MVPGVSSPMVPLSSDAVVGSSTGATVTVIVATLLSAPSSSLARNVKLSVPLKLPFGV